MERAIIADRQALADETCDVLKDVGQSYGYLAGVCRMNIVEGEAWWDGMPHVNCAMWRPR